MININSPSIIGLSFGDEGKGLTTSFLCSQTKKPIVVRYNGGHQAGHTVVHNGNKHVFSSFGSGTLQGAPTYWSKFCTFYPTAFLNEFDSLDKPIIFVDPLCPVTTPLDVAHNQRLDVHNNNGTVGVGFGETIKRQENYYKLYFQDLKYKDILTEKLKGINYYYTGERKITPVLEEFIHDCQEALNCTLPYYSGLLHDYSPIFEGAQGILLDMDFGFFPHVTRSNTTTKNKLEICRANDILCDYHDRFYVTRSYLTRHGQGPLPGECNLNLKNNLNETNVSGGWQGDFRTAPLNVDLLNYALECDNHFSTGNSKNLVITCLDQHEIDVDELLSKLKVKFDKVYLSHGPSATDIIEHRILKLA